ncbi:MAG: hypothetical protein GY845_37695 [Planctomycetes bacterium]|nr:hypothetical protein [Planctomycetota bacterium]
MAARRQLRGDVGFQAVESTALYPTYETERHGMIRTNKSMPPLIVPVRLQSRAFGCRWCGGKTHEGLSSMRTSCVP